MRSDASTKLVAIALAEHAKVKHVAAELERRGPDVDAASALVEAHRAGEAALLEAVSAGRIRWQTAANVLACIPMTTARLSELLRSSEELCLRLGTEIVWMALGNGSSGRGTWIHDAAADLAPLVREVLGNPAVSMAPGKRARLETWVTSVMASHVM